MSGRLVYNQDFGQKIEKHVKYPIYKTDCFRFYRCLKFDQQFYGVTVSALHAGNLRESDYRYSDIFEQKVSYWAADESVAMSEMKKNHCKGQGIGDYLMFWAYDDRSSTFPTRVNQDKLIVIDGVSIDGLQPLLEKIDNKQGLTCKDRQLIKDIMEAKPDCLMYESKAKKHGVNYLFFESGFAKLSLREVSLHIGKGTNRRKGSIVCAYGNDYCPIVENYGKYFDKILKTKFDESYLGTTEYKTRKAVFERSKEEIRKAYDNHEV